MYVRIKSSGYCLQVTCVEECEPGCAYDVEFSGGDLHEPILASKSDYEEITEKEYEAYMLHKLNKETEEAIIALPTDDRIDWDQRRYEIARDCLAAMTEHGVAKNWGKDSRQLATWAVQYADALIAELKKKSSADTSSNENPYFRVKYEDTLRK